MADKLLTFGPQPEQQDEGVSNNLLPVGTTLAAGTGLAALGFYKTNSGKRIWDTYNSAIAATESLSPGGILKTFRISELTSILGTQQEEDLTRFLNAGKYGEMLKKSISKSATGAVKFMPSAGGIFGEIVDETGKAVAQAVRIQAGTQQGNAIADYYARILGIELGHNESINDYILRQTWEESDLKVPFNIWKNSLPQSEKYRKVVLAAPMEAGVSARLTKGQVVSNLARAHTASQIGRLNNLLRKPLDIVDDIPILGNLIDKFPGLGTMTTKPGSATAMLGGFVKKAIIAGAAWKALEYADYLRSQDNITAAPLTTGIFAAAGGIGLAKPGAPFNKIGLLAGAALGLGVSFMPRFDEGIFYGGASLLSDTDTLRAQVSDITGYTQSIKEQNEITKNLITVGTAVGFAGTGALVAGLGSYGVYLRDVYKERNAGETLAHLAERKRFETGALIKEFWESERGRKLAEKPLFNKISKIRSPLAIGAIAGLAVWQGAATALSLLSGNIRTAIPGLPLIMSEESAAEKEAIYSGEQEVAIKKGRWWEFGRSEYEGTRSEYYRQHAIPRLRARAYQKGLYNSEEERWAYDPMVNPIKALFGSDEWKYYYERKYAYERPAPISKPLFADVPFIGSLLAATLGELIKPTKLIRPEEWQVEGGGFLYRPDIRGETEPAYQYGGLLPGSPVMPGETSQLLNELNYRRTEMIGLPGFMEESIREALTGRAEPFQNLQTIAAMGSETNITSWFWEHLNIGGFGGLCLPAGEKVLTPSGLKSIESLSVGDIVYDLNFDEKQIIDVFSRTCKETEKIITINTRCGNQYLRMTGNHPVAIYKRIPCRDSHARPCTPHNTKRHCAVCGLRNTEIKWQWIEAKDIEAGDFIAMPLPKEEQNTTIDLSKYTSQAYTDTYIYSRATSDFATALEAIEANPSITRKELRTIAKDCYAKEALNSFKKKHQPKRISRKIEITNELASFIGWWIAEGSVDKTSGEISFVLNKNEYDIAVELGKKYTSIFSFNYNIVVNKDVNSLRLKITNKPLANFLAQFGTSAKTKKLSWLKNLPIEQLSYLLEGLLEGDGWNNKQKAAAGFTSASNELVRDTWLALARFGIFTTVVDNYLEIPNENSFYPQGTKRKKTLRSYLELAKNQRNRYEDKILNKDFENLEFSNGRNFTKDGFLYISVRNVFSESAKDIQVFDIEVADTHCFVGEYVLLHNSEGIRRFIPSKRSYMQEYNPLRAESPSWIPEDYFLDLKYGNPFDKIKEAEIRLPGAGFAALHPEVEGLSPEEYPLAYRVKVLGDIAMYSEEYEMALREAKSLINTLPPNQARMILQTEKQVKAKKKRKEFSEYMSISNELTEEQVTVTDILSPHLIRTKEYGTANVEVQGIGAVKNAQESMEYMKKALLNRSVTIHTPTDDVKKFDSVTAGPRVKALVMMNGSVNIAEQMARTGLVESNELEREFKQFNYSPNERLAGVLSDAILHNMETPLDYLTPFAPVQKFIHQRSALEDYAATQVYGTKNAFWDKPIENFFEPAKDMFLYKSGLNKSIPEHIQEKRNINEYFDMLKWVKYSRLEQKARMLGDLRTATQARTEKHKTVFGMDVFSNPTNIMRALPRDERDYFSAFIGAGDQERQQILEMVPDNVKRVYTAQWLSKSAAASFAKKEAGLANEQDLQNINMLRQLRASQGFPYSESSIDQWMRETSGQVPFDDYIREQKAAEYFATHSLPDPAWIGFNPAVDMDDIRMKYVENHSMDFHDFDLWDQRKAAMSRKPYIPEAVGEMNANAPYQDAYSASQNLRRLANTYGSGRHKINTYQIDANTGGNRYNITVDDQRKSLVESAFKTLGA